MKPQGTWPLVTLVLVACGCAPIPSRALLELSEREGRFYHELRPALVQARDTFDLTADALITSTANRQAAITRREATPTRQAIYESLAAPDPSTGAVEMAIRDLITANVAIQVRIEKEKAAGQQRLVAIVQTFEALDTTLGAITENQQAIHGHLEGRRRLFGGPGRSAFLPFTTIAELRASLRQSIDTLEAQFKLAKELVNAAKKEFGDQVKTSGP